MAASFFKNDLDVLNFALTLEHLEAAFYKQAVASGTLQGNAQKYFTIIGAHEQAHVDGLTQAISKAGGTPVKPRASYDFTPLGDPTTPDGLLKIANVLEPTGVKAYDGAAPAIQDKSILATAGSIVQVEARHAAIIKVLMDPDTNPVPDAFAPALDPQAVLDAVKPLLGPEQ